MHLSDKNETLLRTPSPFAKNRDGIIDVFRFLFCLLIMVHHSYLVGAAGQYAFKGAYIFVEFFFFLTGYYTARHFDTPSCATNGHEGLYAAKYTFKKFKAVFPYVFLCVVVHYLLIGFHYGSFNHLQYAPFEILMLEMSGIYPGFSILPLWYLSAMFLVLPLLIYLLLRFKDLVSNLLCVLLPLVIYGYFYVKNGYLVSWNVWLGFLYDGVLRAAAGILVGFLIYRISTILSRMPLRNAAKRGLTFFGIFCLLLLIYLTLRYSLSTVDFLAAGLLAVLLIVVFSKQSSLSFPSNRFLQYLGEISLPLYVCHWTVGKVFEGLFPGTAYRLLLPLYFLLSFVYANGLLFLTRKRKKLSAAKAS